MQQARKLLIAGLLAAAVLGAQTIAPPTVTKSFAASVIPVNGTTAVNFTVANPNDTATLTGITMTDNLPAGLVLAANPNGGGSCTAGSGALTALAGSSQIRFTSQNLPAGASCTFHVDVTGVTPGVKANTVTITDTVAGAGIPATATLTVVTGLTLTKSFGAVAVPVGATTTLTFGVVNGSALAFTAGAFTDVLPAGLKVGAPAGLTGTCVPLGNITAAGTTITVTNLALAAGASCSFTVNVIGVAEGQQNNVTTSPAAVFGGTTLTSTPATATIFVGAAAQTSYAANLGAGESYVNLTNNGSNGAPLLGPGFGGAVGNVCVNAYAFSPDEQLVSCCSCLVTPNGLMNLGANRDLVSKTLTGVIPTSIVIKLVTTLAGTGGTGTSCTNSAATLTTAQLAGATVAFGTTLHADPLGGFKVTERPFSQSLLSAGDLASLSGRCAAILGNGSGFGICRSCVAGALGANRIQ